MVMVMVDGDGGGALVDGIDSPLLSLVRFSSLSFSDG